jgi:hypothetical protein
MKEAAGYSAVCCPACRAPLGEATLDATGWERSPWGDEYSDQLHRCENCGAWAIVTMVDRFSGPEETKVDGPLSDEEAAERREAMKE